MSLNARLAALEASGLIRLAQVEPELEYLFRHALVQEAAYETLVKAERKRLHRAAGEALEWLYPERTDELAAILAHHFAAAGDDKKGVAYSRRAARKAVAMYAYDEAVQHLQTALHLSEASELSETRLAVLEELADGYCLLRQGARAISIYQAALQVWRDLPHADRMTPIRLNRKIIHTLAEIKWTIHREEFESIRQTIAASRASLEADQQNQPPQPETVRLLTAVATHAWRIQAPPDWEAALHYAQAAVDMAEQLDKPVELSVALGALAMIYSDHGQLRDYLQTSLKRLSVVQEARFDDLRERIDGLREGGSALMYAGEYGLALARLEEAARLAEHIQAVDQQFFALSLQSQCWFRLDRWDEALRAETRWRNLAQRFGHERLGQTCFAVAISATIHALRGDFSPARSLQTESYDLMASFWLQPGEWLVSNPYY